MNSIIRHRQSLAEKMLFCGDGCRCQPPNHQVRYALVLESFQVKGVQRMVAKKKAAARKSSGTAGIETVEDDEQIGNRIPIEEANGADEVNHVESNGKAPKAERKPKAKSEPKGDGSLGIGEIRKAATFANSVGGLDKAIALLQILKVAKEVQ